MVYYYISEWSFIMIDNIRDGLSNCCVRSLGLLNYPKVGLKIIELSYFIPTLSSKYPRFGYNNPCSYDSDQVFITKLYDTKMRKHKYILSIFLKAALALKAAFEISVIATTCQFAVLSSPALLAITLLAGARFFVWLCNNEGGDHTYGKKTIPDEQPQFEDALAVNYKIVLNKDMSVDEFKEFLKRRENYKIGDCDSDGCSALHIAVQTDNLPLIEHLAKEGGTKIHNQK